MEGYNLSLIVKGSSIRKSDWSHKDPQFQAQFAHGLVTISSTYLLPAYRHSLASYRHHSRTLTAHSCPLACLVSFSERLDAYGGWLSF